MDSCRIEEVRKNFSAYTVYYHGMNILYHDVSQVLEKHVSNSRLITGLIQKKAGFSILYAQTLMRQK